MLKEISFLSLAQLTQITPTKHTPPGEVAVSYACFKVKIALSKRKYHKQRWLSHLSVDIKFKLWLKKYQIFVQFPIELYFRNIQAFHSCF